MKIWTGYGSEHSANLVMIGHFENAENASSKLKQLNNLTHDLSGLVHVGSRNRDLTNEEFKIFQKYNFPNIATSEFEQFSYPIELKLTETELRLEGADREYSVFLKLMLLKGGLVEMTYDDRSENAIVNLKITAKFQSVEKAQETLDLINNIKSDLINNSIEIDKINGFYSDKVMAVLERYNCYNISPLELEHFIYDVSIDAEDEKLVLTCEEEEVFAFAKLMLNSKNKVEIFSAHTHKNTGYGR